MYKLVYIQVCINGLWLLPTIVTTEWYCVLVESFKATCRFKTLDGHKGMRNVSSVQLKPLLNPVKVK